MASIIMLPAFSPAFFSGVSAGGASLPLAKQKFSGGNGALGKRFDAYSMRQSVTESRYINSLSYQ